MGKPLLCIINLYEYRDGNGNPYQLASIIRTSDNAFAAGKIDGGLGAVVAAVRDIFGGIDGQQYTHYHFDLKRKEYKQKEKKWPAYLGCTAEELVPAILSQWDRPF